jgi:hypothetical protein
MATKMMKGRATALRNCVAACFLTANFLASGLTLYQWYSIGPQPIDTKLGFNQQTLGFDHEFDSGRVPALAVDPSNPSHWLAGTAQGGVWETTNAGPFFPRTDNQPSLAIGAIAFAPDTPTMVYAGTGEANFRGDAYAGAGLMLSQNGGTTWQMINTNFAHTSFSHIQVNLVNASNLVVSTTRGGAGIGEESFGSNNIPGAPPRGVFVSTNGGNSFIRALTGEATALTANATNFNDQYAGLGEIYGDPTNGIYRTTNGWQNFELISGPWISTNVIYTNYPIATNIVNGTNSVVYTNYAIGTNTSYPGGRVAMAISRSSPGVLYVGVASVRSDYLAPLWGIWETTNAWDANPEWTELPFPPVEDDDISLPRFWYMFDLLVDPNDPGTLYLAEFNVWRYNSTNLWTSLANWGTTHVHPDHHVMAWVPKGGSTYSMLLGNDGGLYLSDPGVSGLWFSLNSALRITQFYKGAVDPTGANVLALGGAQDEFTSEYNGGLTWPMISGGDGGDCAISSADPLNSWALSGDTTTDDHFFPNGISIFRTLDGGNNVDDAADGITDGLPLSRQFYVHFEKAPYNNDLVIAGTAALWRCANFFSGTIPTWSVNSPTMTGADGSPMPLSAMAFATSDTTGNTYAYGVEDGRLRITGNAGATWSDLDPAGMLPQRYVSGLAFSPADTNTLYVTFSGFNESTPSRPGHLFKTVNAFAPVPVWTDVSPPVDLPNNCLAIDPNNANSIFVGADIGVWQSGDGGGSWTEYGPSTGLPNVAVYDLRFNNLSQLTAFTHGRGAYILSKINIPILVSVEPPFHPILGCLTCPPDIEFLNPGDEVTINLAVQGILPVDTGDLQATLLPSPGIMPITHTQDFGVVAGQGAAVSRSFKFMAGVGGPAGGAGPNVDPCGGTVQAILQLQDQSGSLGQVSFRFGLGQPSHPIIEDFEEGPSPSGLSPGWTSSATGAGVIWSNTTNPPPNMPDSGEDDMQVPVTNTSAYIPDPAGSGQSFLTSPPFTVSTSQAQLYFREAFSTSNSVDGGVLEIAIGPQPFQEITQAGGSFIKDTYNTVLSDRNPLGPRAAWSGNSGGWLPVAVNLPPGAAGQTVRLRWHFGSVFGRAGGGWYVDSVLVTEPLCLPPVTNPAILNPAISNNVLMFAINTVTNRNFIIEYKTNLTEGAWQIFETLPGNGSQQTVGVPIGADAQRFYRFVVQ